MLVIITDDIFHEKKKGKSEFVHLLHGCRCRFGDVPNVTVLVPPGFVLITVTAVVLPEVSQRGVKNALKHIPGTAMLTGNLWPIL